MKGNFKVIKISNELMFIANSINLLLDGHKIPAKTLLMLRKRITNPEELNIEFSIFLLEDSPRFIFRITDNEISGVRTTNPLGREGTTAVFYINSKGCNTREYRLTTETKALELLTSLRNYCLSLH